MTKEKKKKRRQNIWLIIGIPAAVIFVVLLVLVLGVYQFNWNNRVYSSVTRIFPFPAVYIHGAGLIPIGEVKSDDEAVKKFYGSQDFEKMGMRVDFSTDQGKKRLQVKEKEIINKLVENKIIEDLARQRGIVLSDSAVSAEMESEIQQFGNKDNLMSDLARLYGWTLSDFEQKVVKPDLYAEKLQGTYAKEIDTSSQQAKIKSLYDQVTSKKEDFAKVAKDSSDGQSSENGGDLGWSTKDQLIAELADKAYSMKVGEVSPVIESPLGFHILKLEEKKNDGTNDLVHLRQIFVKKTTFADWLLEKMKTYPVSVFLKDYQWNKDTGQVEFRSPEMQKFEQDLPASSQGDPSVF